MLVNLQMFLPHRTELGHFGAEILESQVTLRLPQLAGGQLLLQAGDVVLGNVLPLSLQILSSLSFIKKMIFITNIYLLIF